MILFETERLFVRQYTSQDKDNFFALNGNKEIMQYIRTAKTKEESDAFLQENISYYEANPLLGRWAAMEKNTLTYVGSFALIPVEQNKSNIQIGYALLFAAWGKGYATELVKHGTKFFFAHHNAVKLYAVTEYLNLGSQKVLLKCGFQRDGVIVENSRELPMFSIERKVEEI